MSYEPGDERPGEKPTYNQEFFIVLALRRKEAWNEWRRDPANKDVRVTFAGIDFSEAPRDGVDFSGFEFGDHADLSRCKWRGVEWAEIEKDPEAFASGRACFIGAAFGKGATFAGAAFGDSASFKGATFGGLAIFIGADFGAYVNFSAATFKGNVKRELHLGGVP